MIEKGLIDWISRDKGIVNRELIEKDLLLQGLLVSLAKSDYFKRNYAFKGGTCLTKAYFGYYRFSEDLDFTWMHPQMFENLSGKGVRKKLTQEVNQILALLETSAKEVGLDFKPEKSNDHYTQFGGGKRFATFKCWYKSTTTESESFIKIQINFVELLIYSPKIMDIKPLYSRGSRELEVLYPDNSGLATRRAELFVYDIREIAAEKIRAILTRKGIKARDYIDLYILDQKQTPISSVLEAAMKKTLFMLDYEKYAQNLFEKKFDQKTELGKEENLLINPVEKGFPIYTEKAQKILANAAETLRNEYTKTKSWSELTKPLKRAKKKVREEDVVDLVHRIRKEK